MSDFVLTDEQRKQIAVEYLIAARDSTEHLLISKVAKMPSSDHQSQYAKLLADAYVYEIQALKNNMQSNQPKDISYIQNYTAKLIAEDHVPDSKYSISRFLDLLSREGAHQDILNKYAQQLQSQEPVR